jgi:hypothetical protein
MSKIATPASNVGEKGNTDPGVLRDDELDKVSGGTTHEIVSPRDSASGLPTGKRQHKPFVIT